MPRRKVISAAPDPARRGRWLYGLDCGHTVSRRTNGSKAWAYCGYCPAPDGHGASL